MFKKKNILILALILVVIIINIIPAQPPTTNIYTFDEGYSIVENSDKTLKQNRDYQFNFFVFNQSTGKILDNTSIVCTLFIASDEGNVIYSSEVEYFPDGHWGEDVAGGNFSRLGSYAYGIKCVSDNFGGSIASTIEVTPTGLTIRDGTSSIYISLLFVFIFFLAMSIFSFVRFDNLLNRVGMVGFSYLLLIAISFIAWNMANDFLISNIFIAVFFKWMFIFLIIGAFPMLIGAFAWYVIMIFKIKEIENLMEKGIPEQEAYGRVKRR
jgi:hypothetical protein